MRNKEATIGSTLHNTEGTVASGGTNKTNIKEGLEWAIIASLDLEVLTVSLLLTFEQSVHLLEVQETTGEEQTCGVASGVVGKTSSEAELLELSRGGLGHDVVTLQSWED